MNTTATLAGKNPLPHLAPELGVTTGSFSSFVTKRPVSFDSKILLTPITVQNQLSTTLPSLTFITDKIFEVATNIKSLSTIGETITQSSHPLLNLLTSITEKPSNLSSLVEPLITKSTSLMELTLRKEPIDKQVFDFSIQAQRSFIDSLIINNDRVQALKQSDPTHRPEHSSGIPPQVQAQGTFQPYHLQKANSETQFQKYQFESFDEWLEYLCSEPDAKQNESELQEATQGNSLWDSLKHIVSSVINHLHRILAL